MNKQTNRYQFRFLFSFIIYVFFFRYVLVYGRIWIENQKNNINDIIDKPDIRYSTSIQKRIPYNQQNKKKTMNLFSNIKFNLLYENIIWFG